MSAVDEELKSLLDEITEENLANLDYEELMELRKKLNPYGRTIEGSDSYLTFSFTNLKEKYMEKLITTTMIGFLNRACDEYLVPDGFPIIPVEDYLKDKNALHNFHKDWKLTPKLEKEIAENNASMEKRVIIKEFINYLFQFNPDNHVRGVYKPNPRDLDRSIISTPAANLSIDYLKLKDPKFRETMLEYDRVQHLRAMKTSDGKGLDLSIDELYTKNILVPTAHYSQMDFEKWTPEDRNLLHRVCNTIPPADIFGTYRNYLESNYDKLREAVLHLYCDKAEFDIAINPYQWHEDEQSAIDFQKKHRDEVIADIIKAASGKWNFFAPFEKVQSTVKFFNKNTSILEDMTQQIEMDHKIGADLMRKRMSKKKAKNIVEEGPNEPAFDKWMASNPNLSALGAENPNLSSYASRECPDNAVQVDVFSTKDGKLVKDKFFTKAETPTINEHYK